MNSYEAAARILIVYESSLPYGRGANLEERVEAMRRAVDVLGLKETVSSGENFKELIRAAAECATVSASG